MLSIFCSDARARTGRATKWIGHPLSHNALAEL